MSTELYACVHAAEFPAQVLLRLRPDLQSHAVAVLEGRAPLERICAMNALARQKGTTLAMTRHEAQALPDLCLLTRSTEGELSARAVFLESLASFSPRIEEATLGTECAFVLDIAGTERLFGPPVMLEERMRAALLRVGFRASVAVSGNFHVARMKAAASRGIAAINLGEEASAMAKLPIGVLDLEQQHRETFELWGIRTLGELAALPETDLIARLGQDALIWRELAEGKHSHAFQPIEAKFTLKEFCAFDNEVEEMESLLFMSARMIDCLAGRAASRAMALTTLTVQMKLVGGSEHTRELRPALATIDRKFLLKLLQLELAAHPPQAAVVALTITAEAGQSSKVQLGLFAPQMPEPSRLDVTIARLKAIAGEERVGTPQLEDTQQAGRFRMAAFQVGSASNETRMHRQSMALRRMRPPLSVRVDIRANCPALFNDGRHSYQVTAAFGPWRSSGCWWATDEWDTDEWDVLAQAADSSPVACLLVLDRARNHWQLEAFYD